MSKKNLGAKLARGVRQARRAVPTTVTKAAAKPAQKAAPKAVSETTPTAVPRAARQAERSPSGGIDNPWTNLHPERIWPD